MNRVFALVDCNNFYASCERVFNPKLIGKPVVILSNNDGCVIARSNEAKKVGVPMGVAAYECREIFNRYDVKVFSSNFTLYGDISDRVMTILSEYTDEMEIYSIDEAFLNYTYLKEKDYEGYSRKMVKEVQKGVGIPISVGIAPTKTLAKLANKVAKKQTPSSLPFERGGAAGGGVFDLTKLASIDDILEKIAINDVWGIGYRNAIRLNNIGVYTVLDFKNTKRQVIKANLGVMGERTWLEISGTPCVEMIKEGPKKGIMSSRSFGKAVTKLDDLKEAVATYVCRAAEKLREQGSLAGVVIVSVRTKDLPPGKGWVQHYSDYAIMPLEVPTDYNPDLIKAALKALEKIYIKGAKYKKASVMLSGIMPKTGVSQMDLFGKIKPEPKKDAIMSTMDSVNLEWGREVLQIAATGVKKPWRDRKNFITNRFTTEWDEILEIKI